MKPPYAIVSVPSLSGHAIAYRWRSLARVRRHRASKPQGSSERVLPWQITMDQLLFASLFHTHYRYEVGMLKVPAVTSGKASKTNKCNINSQISGLSVSIFFDPVFCLSHKLRRIGVLIINFLLGEKSFSITFFVSHITVGLKVIKWF